MSEQEERAEREMTRAHERLQKLASFNGPYGARVGAEQQYAQAYQALVRLGLRPQIRTKYRQAVQ